MDLNIQNNLTLILACTGIIISIIWWCWTMNIIRKVLKLKNIEVVMLDNMITDIRQIKQTIRNNLNQKI
jgi:hypothetical protein